WDFVDETANGTDDIWLICDGRDYPRLCWQFPPPVLEAEPEETLGTSNLILWSAVPDANAYWVECAEDANFQYVVDTSGWISETSYVFFGLETSVTYWYRVKAGYYCDIESWWSNVESSTQVQLADAVLALLEPNDVKNENMLLSLANKLDAIQGMMDKGQYKAAISKLENDILQKTDGCAETGTPDKNDWITTCERQELVYPIIIEIIELLSDE
ncbi:MAG: fibronectin type III domain-containing protein, partial [Sedimentisphaerales bacterium]